MNFWNLLFLGKQNFYHKTHWYEALFAKVVGAGKKLIAKFLKIKGNTIVWNQQVYIPTTDISKTANNVTFVDNRDGTYTVSTTSEGASAQTYTTIMPFLVLQNHVYLVTGSGSSSVGQGVMILYSSTLGGHTIYGSMVKKTSSYSEANFQIIVKSGAVITTPIVVRPQIFDLTAMFGSTKADEIYAMEQSQSGSGVAYFRSLFPLPYYQYEQGKLLSFGTPQQVTFNQMVDAPATSGDYDVQGVNLTYGTNTITLNSGTSTNGFKTAYNRYDLTSGHKYAVWGSPKSSNVNNYYLFIADSTGNTSRKAIFAEPVIYDCQVTENARLYVHVEQGATANHNVFQPQIIDLTVMYGSGKEPSIEYFRQVFNEDYYPYDSGSVVSANVSGIKTVGFNQWDEETRTDGFFNNSGTWVSANTMSSKNPMPVFPNAVYYCAEANGNASIYVTQWTKPVPSGVSANQYFIRRDSVANGGFITDPNCHAIHINCGSAYGTTYNNDICINISSDKNGTYEPYIESTVSIPTSTYFPKGMMGVGTAFDELTNTKAIHRMREIDMGDVEWQTGTYAYYITPYSPSMKTLTSNVVCDCAVWVDKASSSLVEGEFTTGAGAGTSIWFPKGSYATASDFRTAMAGHKIQFEIAEEQVVDIDPPLKLNYQVWEGGTEQLLPINTDVPVTSPILADIKYPDGERDNQYFTYRQYLPNSQMLGMALNTILGRSVSTEHTQEALDILMKGE